MFASRIAEAELKSAKCSRRKAAITKPPTLERQVRGDAASFMRFLQRTIGNQATPLVRIDPRAHDSQLRLNQVRGQTRCTAWFPIICWRRSIGCIAPQVRTIG